MKREREREREREVVVGDRSEPSRERAQQPFPVSVKMNVFSLVLDSYEGL